MKLAIVGLGLVSPAGLTCAEHVFFVRAGAPPPRASPFMLASGDRAPVAFCPWIGARAPMAERLGRLAAAALDEAMRPLDGVEGLGPAQLFVCMARPRPGLTDADRAGVERLLAGRLGVAGLPDGRRSAGQTGCAPGPGAPPARLSGEAAPFAALELARDALAGGDARAAVIVAVDSFVSVACLADRLARSPSPWAEPPLWPAEGAAALVVMDPGAAARLGVAPLGHVLGATTAPGTSTDDDDEIVDGAAMTKLLRSAPLASPLGAVFGQIEVDSLRQTEWLLAAARSAARLDPDHESRCLEGDIGAVGAASGAMSLAYGLAFLRHGAARSEQAVRAPFAAWAISRDGLRGLACLVAADGGEGPMEVHAPARAPGSFMASRGRPHARPIATALFTAGHDEPGGGEEEDPFAGAGARGAAGLSGGAPDVSGDEPPAEDGEASPGGDPDATDLLAEFDALEREATEALAASGPDDPLADFSGAEPPPVSLAGPGGEPAPIGQFYAEIVDACADVMASLARDRSLRPARERPATEARILEQLDALHATGSGCIDDLYRAFRRSLESRDPWRIWAPVFALGCIDGGEPLRAIVAGLEGLPKTGRAHGRAAAEALAVAPHPGLDRLAAGLLASPHPVARAVGIDVCSRRGALPPDALAAHLDDPSAPVVEAALHALGREGHPEPKLVPALRRRMLFPDAAVAWQAARLLLLWGHDDPCIAVREGEPEAAGLGAQALEVFVLGGDAADLARMEAWLARAPITPAVLSAIARFGHAGAWAFLAHHLADDALSDAAAAALETLFGERVPAAERKLPRAWRAAIAAARLDPGVRYRRGAPWTPEGVVAEWADGALPRGEIALRADELVARARAGGAIDGDEWTPAPEVKLEALGAAACAALRSAPAGRWR